MRSRKRGKLNGFWTSIRLKDSPHDARRIVKLKIHHTFYENSVTASTHYLIKMKNVFDECYQG
ncbi:hypothetical protein D4509_11490 [Salmonella enterica subsp. enterica]|nr:hypothetical protein [Salmonella enterica]ECE7002736.1 hypothetical protein [Salmonella enterica subsp. enterica]ECE7358838.1 hypothetical protein [Salmonella enterica subsp. enterica]ECI4852517.1 hypothetical protein [Salmonella enterica subsp. enterica]ECI5529373.1 hypothetical protein [Salmonella enterica subsp. enterica]